MKKTNMKVKITSVAKQLPKYDRETKDIIPFVKLWMQDQDVRFQRKVIKLFEGAGVDKRYSIMDPEEVFVATSFEEKNNIYAREVVKLAEQSLKKALDKAQLKATDIDYIITVSCTGIMIPSMDAYLINSLQMKQDVVRLPVTEMGCAAGVSGIIYAKNFLKANPNKRAVVIAVEAPTATFQLDDYSMSNIVSAAIFGDGASAVILSSYEDDQGPVIIDEAMYHFYDATHMMGFNLVNTGLQMVQTVEELFGVLGKNIDDTKEVLRLYGNMSSATVLYVLERFMDKNPAKGERGLMLSFGPGFSAQRILLEW
jgi:alkylresorcinol/alkylpyrone synthase